MTSLASEGYALSDLAQRPTAALSRMASALLPSSDEGRREQLDESRASGRVERLMSATRTLNPTALRAELTQSVLELGPVTALDDVLSPFLTRLGEEWACGDASVAHEHMASAVVRDVLGWLLQSAVPGEDAPALVAATIAGEAHEFGAMMAAIVAAVAGWRVLYLGPNTPAADLARFAREAKARLVVVSIAAERERADVQREIAALRETLGARTKIVAGGTAAANHRLSLRRAKIEILDSRSALRSVLDSTWRRDA